MTTVSKSTRPPPGTPRWRRWLAWSLGGLLVTALLGLLAGEAVGWRFLRTPVQDRLARTLGVAVRIDAPFALHLLRPPALAVGGLWIAAAPDSGAPFLVDARDARLQWRWADLWALRRGEPLRVKGLEAERIEAHLRRERNRPASWSFPMPGRDKRDEPHGSRAWPQFDRLQLDNGQLHVVDDPTALALEARFRIDEARAAASPASAASAPAFMLEAEGRYRAVPARLSLSSPQVLPFVAGAGAPPVQVALDASVGRTQLSYDGNLTDLLGERQLDGDFRISGPSLGAVGEPLGLTLPTTPPFKLNGRLTKTDPVWRVAVAQASIGRSRLAGEFAYDPQPSVPKLTGRLRGSRLALEDLAPSVGDSDKAGAVPTTGKAPAPGAAAGPRLLPDRALDLPSLQRMDADVVVALDELDLSTDALDPLRPLKGHLLLAGAVLRVEDLDARTAGGSVAGRTELDASVSPPRWGVDLRWRGVDLAGWLRGARKPEATVTSTSATATLKRERAAARTGNAPVKAYVTGELQGQARLSGRGRSTAQILASLEGEARALVRDGTVSHLVIELMGIDVAQSLGVWIKGDDSLPLRCAAVQVDAKRGVLVPRVAVFDTPDTMVLVSGSADLQSESLNLRAVAKPKDFSFVALRSPLRVQGTFSDPQPRIEPGPIAARLVASAALALVNPLAALLPLFDVGSGPNDGCADLGPQLGAAAR